MRTKCILEICVDSLDSLDAAIVAGVDRIELCSALSEGGLTPSMAFVREAVKRTKGSEIHVMVRPRGGDFVYSEAEQEMMLREVEYLKQEGVSGVVLGALTLDAEIDRVFMTRVVERLGSDVQLTFHRAFDLLRNRHQALEELISLGVDHILTSGGAKTALDGTDELARLVQQAKGRIGLIVASGVHHDNIELLFKRTQAQAYHSSAKRELLSSMTYVASSSSVRMGRGDEPENKRYIADRELIERLYRALERC